MAFFLDPLVSKVVDLLSNLAKEKLDLILGVPDEIKRLRKKVLLIHAVLNDAEKKQNTEAPVKIWLSDLRDFMYDADDILDEYRIAAEEWASQENRPEEPSVGCRMLPICGCFGQIKSTHDIGVKIKDLNLRLNDILDIKFTLDLKVSEQPKVVPRVDRETTSELEPDIVGEAIEKNTRDLVELLTRKEEDTNANVVVLAIVGIGGIGKTTLAQKIINDRKIKAVFKKPMWVCVSKEFVATDLLKEIITSAGKSPGEARSKEQLGKKVNDVLKDTKFLLVLDDVWDAKIWVDLLRKTLHGAVGSRVVVTTRDESVALLMGAIHIHSVDPLTPQDSWLLLCKKVTMNEKEESDLKDIGTKIVEKCHGLPIAITVVGGMLRKKKRCKDEWNQVDRSLAWSLTGLPHQIHQALYLSYEDLPSHLKQCFLLCSLIREDSRLYKTNLVQLWIAEGFVGKGEGEEYLSLEEIAQGYFDELIQRSLLQAHKQDFGAKHLHIQEYELRYCMMHDLLRSLCHFLARGENLVIRDISKGLPNTANDDSIKLRRLSIVAPESEDIKTFLHLTQRHKSVRTLLLEQITTLDDKDLDNCFNNFQRLRVVHVHKAMIQSLPQSVKKLLHLRYLNLSYCREVKALPESIASLKTLQFLILEGCHNLQTLPKGVVELRNLRTLYVPEKVLPSGIERLEHLNVLRGAVVIPFSSDSDSSNSCSLEEISKLRKLRELSIKQLKIKGGECNPNANGLNGSLTALTDLVDLQLDCNFCHRNCVGFEKIFDVALHPPSSVHYIVLDDFIGCQFPRWLMSNSISTLLPNLTKLILTCCQNCSLLPPLGKLPNLESLALVGLDAVRSIGKEFFGYEEASTSDGFIHESGGSRSASSSPVLFPRLKRLRLEFFVNLEAWQWLPEDAGTVAMPQLKKLLVSYCPSLSSLPKGLNRQATCLTKLFIIRNNLNLISGFPSVKYMLIRDDIGCNIISDLPALEVLEVLHGASRTAISIPDWLVRSLPHLTSLHRLNLTCSDTQLLYENVKDGPDWPKIRHIPIVEISDCNGNYIIHNKSSSTFQTNINFE